MIAIVAAVSKNGVIGKDGKLPWHLPADLLMFKHLTMGHAVVMGRKTYESIGKALPGRFNIIMTRDKKYFAPDCVIANSVKAAIFAAKTRNIFVIGGAEVYRQFLPITDRLHLTLIDHDFSGDAYFPAVDWTRWKEVKCLQGIKNDRNPYDFYFRVFDKIRT